MTPAPKEPPQGPIDITSEPNDEARYCEALWRIVENLELAEEAHHGALTIRERQAYDIARVALGLGVSKP
jgi:hypothetical protein